MSGKRALSDRVFRLEARVLLPLLAWTDAELEAVIARGIREDMERNGITEAQALANAQAEADEIARETGGTPLDVGSILAAHR